MNEKQKIIVMGGSFNPPTIAHYSMLNHVVEQLGADMGLFVPVSEAYLKRKMRKSLKNAVKNMENAAPMQGVNEAQETSKKIASRILLSEEMRQAMLEAMCEQSDKLYVDDTEMRFPELYTHQTMEKLQEKYPDAKLYFLSGDDKMDIVRGWATGEFIKKFKIALVCRQLNDLEQIFVEDEILSAYRERFVFITGIEGIETISSTRVREFFVEGDMEQAKELLHPDVWKLFKDLKLSDFPEEIEKFEGEYACFNNAYPCSFEWNGQCWICAEAAYQSSKCKKAADALRFVKFGAEKAKATSKKVELRDDWEVHSFSCMEEILRAKFLQKPQLAEKLLNTGNRKLVFGNNKDTFWGVNLYTNVGENQLGKMLMRLRDELQERSK